MDTVEILILVLLLLGLYPFTIYPFLIFILSKIFKKEIRKANHFEEPYVSIVVPVFNEEENIEEIVQSIKNSSYPLSKIQLIFGSDGSTDSTNKILEKVAIENNFVEYYIFPRNGKNFVLNRLLEKANHEIILFLDADIRITKGLLHKIVAYFSDENVGGVLTNIIITKNHKSNYQNEEHQTQKFFTNIRKWESEIFATVNNTGPCYAARKSLLSPIPNDKVCDDFYILLKIISKGKRMVVAEDCIVFDIRQRDDVWKEYHRKKRFSAGGISAILAVPEIFSHPILLFMIFSHKILRWLSPIFIFLAIILAFLSNLILIKFLLLFVIVLFLLLVLFGTVKMKTHKHPIALFSFPLYIFLSTAGTVAGIIRAILGKRNASWTLEKLEN
ncbi:MAG: glycosyltransferase [Candidatus Kapaibacteriota bacterium]